MPIKFVTLNKEFAEEMKKQGKYQVVVTRIQNYKPDEKRETYYVSPANSHGWMDGGIDEDFSKMFPGIGGRVRRKYREVGKVNKDGKEYLPIGSSVIIPLGKKKFLVSAPTMLIPEDVQYTNNAYFSTMAVLYNVLVNGRKKLDDVNILLTSMCCGCGKMKIKTAVQQILQAITDYRKFRGDFIGPGVVVNEPNLDEQPVFRAGKF